MKSACAVPTLEGGSARSYRESFPEITESKLMRKIDLRVVSFVFILNFFTFLDR